MPRLTVQQIKGDSFSFAEENEFLNEADLHIFQIFYDVNYIFKSPPSHYSFSFH